MIIDFHTHFFPDRIARESVEKLAHKGGVPYFGDGTMNGLLSFMKEDGVTLSVNQPVATKPEQVVSINRKMVELNRQRKDIICFGALHPDFPGYEEEAAFLKENGVKGVKLHPEYQNFCPEDKRMRGLYEACAKNGLIVLFHAGVDLGYASVHCTPRGSRELLGIQGLTLVLAHMGGYKLWDDVEKYLVEENVYLDLAYCQEMDNAQLKRMIVNHGADKVLFATDFPWERARTIVRKIESLGLSDSDRDRIFFRNAAALLNLPAHTPA